MSIRPLWLVLLLQAWVCSAQQPSLRYDVSGSNGWYPYYINNADNPGINAELIPDILAMAGIEGVPMTLPPKRTVMALNDGLLDFDITSPSWFANGQLPEGFVISAPLYAVSEYFVSKAGHEGWLDGDISENALRGAKIGTVRGYAYHDEHVFDRVDFASERDIILALQKGRIDYAIVGDLPARYWAEQLGANIQFGPRHSHGHIHLRLREDKAHLLPSINQAIDMLDALGLFSYVMNKYAPYATVAYQTTEFAP